MIEKLNLYINESFRSSPFTILFFSLIIYILFQNKVALHLFILISLTDTSNKFLKLLFKKLYSLYPQLKNILGNGERPKNAINCGCFIDPLNPSQKATSYGLPSGHSEILFSIASFLSLYFNNFYKTNILFLLASYGAYTRITMGCHSLNQVVLGGFIGILFGYLYYFFINKFNLV